MNIWIFGDSFASSNNKDSWTTLLGNTVINKATNGSSEYRIWKTYYEHCRQIKSDDVVIFCHTSFSRVFLKNTSSILSRLLPSHPVCDLIFSDIIDKKENKFINILKSIWDEDYFKDTYNLMIKDLKQVPNSLHINFFEDSIYKNIWIEYPGNINHLNKSGNMAVYFNIAKQLK
jgi:hypothetical protein